jgi:hypothetical protein
MKSLLDKVLHYQDNIVRLSMWCGRRMTAKRRRRLSYWHRTMDKLNKKD